MCMCVCVCVCLYIVQPLITDTAGEFVLSVIGGVR